MALDFQEFQKRKDDFEVKAGKYCLGELDFSSLTHSVSVTLGQSLPLEYHGQPSCLPRFLGFSTCQLSIQNRNKEKKLWTVADLLCCRLGQFAQGSPFCFPLEAFLGIDGIDGFGHIDTTTRYKKTLKNQAKLFKISLDFKQFLL